MALRYMRLAGALLILILFHPGCKNKEKAAHQSPKKPVVKQQPKPAPKKTQPSNSAVEQKLGLTNKQIKENKLYSFINDWYGVPYKYGGCLKSGVDCSCFTNVLYEAVYGKKIARSASDMFLMCEKIQIDEARQGDLVFFKIGGNKVSHVGVYLKGKLFVHASTSSGVSINSIEEAYYKKYFFCAGKVKEG